MHKLPAPEMDSSPQCPLKAVQRTGGLTEKGKRERKHQKIKPSINITRPIKQQPDKHQRAGRKAARHPHQSSPKVTLLSSLCSFAAPACIYGEAFSKKQNSAEKLN